MCWVHPCKMQRGCVHQLCQWGMLGWPLGSFPLERTPLAHNEPQRHRGPMYEVWREWTHPGLQRRAQRQAPEEVHPLRVKGPSSLVHVRRTLARKEACKKKVYIYIYIYIKDICISHISTLVSHVFLCYILDPIHTTPGPRCLETNRAFRLGARVEATKNIKNGWRKSP